MNFKHLPIIIFPILLLSCTTKIPTTNNPSLREVMDKTLIPEGIAVHPQTGIVYLSSLHKNKIVSVARTGTITDIISSGQEGYMWGLGMKFSEDGKVLWSCTANGKGSAALYAIDHHSRQVIKRYTHDSARFLNDLVITNGGRIFITDTEKGAVFVLQQESLQLFLQHEQLKWANGITATPAGDILFVASGRYGVMKINTADRAITSATGNKLVDYAIDGLVYHNQSLYAAVGWPQDSVHHHRIIRYRLDQQLNYTGADTLAIQQPWLETPTTLAVHKNQLYALSFTNLRLYNKHSQQTDKILDSLRYPVIAVISLKNR